MGSTFRVNGDGTVTECVDAQGAVATVVFDGPPVNALTWPFLAGMDQAIARIDSRYRVAVVRSGIPGIFMAGGDISTLVRSDFVEAAEYVERLQNLMTRVSALDLPVICEVSGPCLGGGLELALACDVIVSSDTAQFGLPEVTLGIIPAAGGVHRLARRVGEGRARLMLLTGRTVGAAESLTLGLVDVVVPGTALADQISILVGEMERLPREAVRAIKRLSATSLDRTVEQGLRAESEAWLVARSTGETQRALDNFHAKLTRRRGST